MCRPDDFPPHDELELVIDSVEVPSAMSTVLLASGITADGRRVFIAGDARPMVELALLMVELGPVTVHVPSWAVLGEAPPAEAPA